MKKNLSSQRGISLLEIQTAMLGVSVLISIILSNFNMHRKLHRKPHCKPHRKPHRKPLLSSLAVR